MNAMYKRTTRVALLALAAAYLYTGLWAVFSAHGWYDGYPGFGHHWVDRYGPFNHHLALDAGSGFTAVGLLLAIVAFRLDTMLLRTAMVVALALGIPHLIFHLQHSGKDMPTFDAWLSTISLALGVVIPAALLWI